MEEIREQNKEEVSELLQKMGFKQAQSADEVESLIDKKYCLLLVPDKIVIPTRYSLFEKEEKVNFFPFSNLVAITDGKRYSIDTASRYDNKSGELNIVVYGDSNPEKVIKLVRTEYSKKNKILDLEENSKLVKKVESLINNRNLEAMNSFNYEFDGGRIYDNSKGFEYSGLVDSAKRNPENAFYIVDELAKQVIGNSLGNKN